MARGAVRGAVAASLAAVLALLLACASLPSGAVAQEYGREDVPADYEGWADYEYVQGWKNAAEETMEEQQEQEQVEEDSLLSEPVLADDEVLNPVMDAEDEEDEAFSQEAQDAETALFDAYEGPEDTAAFAGEETQVFTYPMQCKPAVLSCVEQTCAGSEVKTKPLSAFFPPFFFSLHTLKRNVKRNFFFGISQQTVSYLVLFTPSLPPSLFHSFFLVLSERMSVETVGNTSPLEYTIVAWGKKKRVYPSSVLKTQARKHSHAHKYAHTLGVK